MITEYYVSFEIAKLLKEKGFDCLCHSYFRKDNPNNLVKETCGANWNDTPFFTSRPTLQMAMKWLRIEHNIHIEPHIVRTKYSYGYMPNYIDLKELKQHLPFDEFDFSNADKYACITYDKACEETIKYCLKHLIFNNYVNN
jgi:hypothetical protein